MGVQIKDVGLKFNGQFQQRKVTNYIVLHHADASSATVNDIHSWHLAKGWIGIGYHYYVRKDGTIYRGRPQDAVGAHVEGHNHDSIGICAEGNYMKEKTMPEAQKQAIITLCKELLTIYPNAKIVGHRDLMKTDCPGINYPMQEIIQKVYEKGGDLKMDNNIPFTDIKGHWAEQSIKNLYERGLLAKADKFRPDDNITRAEVVTLIDRVLKYLGK